MPPPRTNSHPTALAPPPPSETSGSGFPIVLIPIVGILATAVLLLGYYAFVTKCCLNWRRCNIIATLSASPRRGNDRFALEDAAAVAHGLGESAIQEIPTLRFRRDQLQGRSHECAVCLNEFREGERMRLLPGCFHVFHIDCIDTWLQSHANCPLCRSDLMAAASIAANPFPEQNPNRNSPELRCNGGRVPELRPEPGAARKTTHVCSMGDECIDRRGSGEEFEVHPMRRSFSMDSSDDRQLCIAVQEILQKRQHLQAMSCGEGCSGVGSGRIRRSFFFGHSRSSKSAVLPIQNEV